MYLNVLKGFSNVRFWLNTFFVKYSVRSKFLQPRMLKNLRRNRGLLKNNVSYICRAVMVLIQYLVNLTFVSHIMALINLREELLVSGFIIICC